MTIYGGELIRCGQWSEDDGRQAGAGMAAARQDPGSLRVGPTLMETRATRWAT
ncbi:hypothetical protein AAJV73_02210 [Cyanobium sp. BSA11S]|uniref:hypothetical protein n=1 Tax=Cyanobium sp. BSA11S TaxID=3108224 RepID=UPI003D81C0CB